MKMAQLAGCLAVGLVLAAPAVAAPSCGDQPTQNAMNQCADAQYRAADKTLNATYGKLLAKLTPAGRGALQGAQRAWLAFRDAQCSFETLGTAGGSVHPFVMSECLEEMTRAQTERLAAQANCTEGDLSCGGQ